MNEDSTYTALGFLTAGGCVLAGFAKEKNLVNVVTVSEVKF